jgi:thioredoxin-like negative regulator of GroEL
MSEQGIILDPLSREDRERAGAAAQVEVVRLRAENERLRTFERAFAKVPQEHQARILEAVRAEAAVDGSDAGRGDWESER